jgi:hypothetical protein
MTPEGAEEQLCDRLFVAAGGIVVKFSQGYRDDPGGTRQTPGIPDRWVFFPKLGKACWFEVKSRKGKQQHYTLLDNKSPRFKPTSGRWKAWLHAQRQHQFGVNCRATNIHHGLGSYDDARALLIDMGILDRATSTRKEILA